MTAHFAQHTCHFLGWLRKKVFGEKETALITLFEYKFHVWQESVTTKGTDIQFLSFSVQSVCEEEHCCHQRFRRRFPAWPGILVPAE